MKDRYLFKAKRADNGKWVQGYLYGIWEKRYILWGMTNDVPNMIEVDPSTICQCTGLKDKNGKLIWENDIIKKFSSGGIAISISKVVLGEHSLNLGWCVEGLRSLCKYDTRLFNIGLGGWDASRCEIVGNIFDNPELLESEEQ